MESKLKKGGTLTQPIDKLAKSITTPSNSLIKKNPKDKVNLLFFA